MKANEFGTWGYIECVGELRLKDPSSHVGNFRNRLKSVRGSGYQELGVSIGGHIG